MELDDRIRSELMDAACASVRFNCPMSTERAAAIASFLVREATRIIDLGCGYGSLLIDIARWHPDVTGLGIDLDRRAITHARTEAVRAGVSSRVRFESGDIASDARGADAGICIAASSAFGGPQGALQALHRRGVDRAVVGDMVWAQAPNGEQQALLGHLPAGEAELARMATTAGWTVVEHASSSIEEWDEFEHGWIRGVRSIGTPEAEAFARERYDEYHRLYRGVAGFGWLFLSRRLPDDGDGQKTTG